MGKQSIGKNLVSVNFFRCSPIVTVDLGILLYQDILMFLLSYTTIKCRKILSFQIPIKIISLCVSHCTLQNFNVRLKSKSCFTLWFVSTTPLVCHYCCFYSVVLPLYLGSCARSLAYCSAVIQVHWGSLARLGEAGVDTGFLRPLVFPPPPLTGSNLRE